MQRIAGLFFVNGRVFAIVALAVVAFIASMALARQLGQAAAGGTEDSNQVIKSAGLKSDTQPASSDSTGDSSSSGAQSSNQGTVNVNGQDIPVPDNGSVSQTIESDGGATQVDVDSQHSVSSNGQASNTTRSSVNINVRSHSSGSSSSEESGL